MFSTLDEILRGQKVIVCAGSGGVGKTTIAATLGVRAAQIGLNVLVLTVDPARRLATALGLDLCDDSERVVEGRDYKGKLSAAVIDSRKTFDQFIARHASSSEAASRILNNSLYKQLSTTLSGSQEFTSLERLLQAVESKNKYDLVILDTPPTKHALDFLLAPQKIQALFQDSVTRWFMDASRAPSGLIASLVQKGARAILKTLEALTGSQFLEELVDFFSAIRSVQATLRERSLAVQKLLSGPRTRFLVVTSFDAAKLAEAHYLRNALRRMGFTLDAVIVNRAFPIWLPNQVESGFVPTGLEDAYAKVLNCYERFKQFHQVRYNLYGDFVRSLHKEASAESSELIRIFRLPEFDQDIHGLEDLERLADRLSITNQPEEK